MKVQLENIRNEIKTQNAKSKVKAEKYEALECWSYAYLSRWVVLEKGLKSLYDIQNKDRIREGAKAWLEYLDGRITKAPDKIKDFSVKTRNIPSKGFIRDALGSCNRIELVLDSKSKYRPKRNDIAHKAEEFSSKEIYVEYRKAVDEAITQLITKLSQKIRTS